MRIFLLLSLLFGLLWPITSSARTWNVRQDGTGDYSVIQDAVDVAEEGDIIDIGPGWYTDYGTFNNGFGWFATHVDVNTDNLTFVGAGPDQTIIGPLNIDDFEIESYGMGHNDDYTWHISGIKFVNFNAVGIYHHYGYLEADNCEFENSERGIYGQFTRGADIRNCVSRSIFSTAFACNIPGSGVLIEDCQFYSCFRAIRFDGCDNGRVINCDFLGGRGTIGYYEGASGEIRDCTMSGFDGFGIVLTGNEFVSITNNIIQAEISGSCMYIRTYGNQFVSNNMFIGGEHTLSFYNAPQIDFSFHNNHILRTTGEYIFTPEYYQWDQHLDLTLNYWGTTDLEEIAAHIIDGRVLPNSGFIVDFEPIAGGPVSTERTTLDGIKAMFR